ncbi:MFS transporter [[Clostridium] fimetarium]|uniref:MFS transporter n=1 Tax=[Clostridium] fimetarium TaxID=99656 RepID=UPI002E8DEB16|nr:MFS transporter [[Clostridium] fimetarium]
MFIAIFSIPLLLAFTWGGDKYAWSSWQIIGMLSLSVIALLVLLFIEKQAKEAVIPLSLFQNSIFNITTITVFLLNALMYGVINYMPLFVQGSMKLSASASGLMMVPMMLGYAAATIVGGQIISRTKKYKVLYFTGFIIMFVGTLIFSFLSMNTSSAIVTAAMFVFGIGAGISFSISMIIVQNAFPYSKVGTVTASFQFFRNFGSVIGVSLLGLVLNNQFRAESKEIVASATNQAMPDNILHMLTSPQSLFDADKLTELVQTVPQNLLDSFNKLIEQSRIALATSMRDVFIVIAIVALVSIILAAFLKEIPLRESNDN